MALTVSTSGDGKEFEKCPAGSYVARCYLVADIGTQKTEFQGEVKNQAKVVIGWEILEDGVKREDGTPFTMSKTFTASLHEKAGLRKMLDGWRGKSFTAEELKGFELANILGVYAQVTVVHEPNKTDPSKIYANISSIAPLHKAIPKPAPVTENVLFDMDAKGYLDSFETLPKWIKEKVDASPEWKVKTGGSPAPKAPQAQAPAQGETFVDDDPPF